MDESAFDDTRCNLVVCGSHAQESFLNQLLVRLDTEPEQVMAEMEAFRQLLVQPSAMRYAVVAGNSRCSHVLIRCGLQPANGL